MPYKKRKIQVLHKTIGGRVKRSCLEKTETDLQDLAVAGPSTIPADTGHLDEPGSSSNEETVYRQATNKEFSVWEALKPELLRVSLESSAPSSHRCCICTEQANYRCLECSNSIVFCETCVKATHRNSLHLPEIWNVSIIHNLYKCILSE